MESIISFIMILTRYSLRLLIKCYGACLFVCINVLWQSILIFLILPLCSTITPPPSCQTFVHSFVQLMLKRFKLNKTYRSKTFYTQVLSAATIVAKHTSALCNVCRVASNKTTNAVAKKHFVQSAKEVAQATAHLVKTIKVCFWLVYFIWFSFIPLTVFSCHFYDTCMPLFRGFRDFRGFHH